MCFSSYHSLESCLSINSQSFLRALRCCDSSHTVLFLLELIRVVELLCKYFLFKTIFIFRFSSNYWKLYIPGSRINISFCLKISFKAISYKVIMFNPEVLHYLLMHWWNVIINPIKDCNNQSKDSPRSLSLSSIPDDENNRRRFAWRVWWSCLE